MKIPATYVAKIRILIIAFLICVSQQIIANELGEDGSAPLPSIESPGISPSGEHILYVTDTLGLPTVWMSRRDGTDATPFINWNDSSQIDPNWSPDGGKIIFSSDSDSNNYDIWIIDADGNNPQKITSDEGNNTQASFAPDGTKILFISDRTGKREIWYMDVDGNNQQAIGLQSLLISDPAWSPSAAEVVFVGCVLPSNGLSISEAPCNLFKITLSGGTTTQLTFSNEDDWSPDWGTSGIIFSSSRGGGHSIWIVSSDGGGLQQLTNGDGLHLDPKWDNLNEEIVFTKSDIPSVWTTDLSGNETLLVQVVATNDPPIANSGSNSTVLINSLVVLDGSESFDPDNGPESLKFAWIQSEGQAVELSNANTAAPSFTAREPGSYTFTLTVDDGQDNASDNVAITTIYDFTGFFSPIGNDSILNVIKAGRTVPTKFSLNGDQGLDIFSAGYPKSIAIECDSFVSTNDAEQASTAGKSSLSYKASTDQYNYKWKTDSKWKRTCRQLIVQLKDGTNHVANFQFK